jgi:glutaconate CoA-transferase subunit B
MVAKYTTNELMAVTASRLLKDGENVVVGLGLPQIAALLAKSTHAPRLNIIYEIGVINPEAEEMGVGIADPRLWNESECFTSFVGTLGSILQKGLIDVGFLGGLQVDKYGNINSTLIKTEKGYRHINGSGGAADIATFSKRLMIIMKHEKRKIIEKVDFLTSVGYLNGRNSRSEAGLPMCQDIKIITNLCVFGFDEEERSMKLLSVHPGITLEEVVENTGVEFKIPEMVKNTEEPTEKEVDLLRNSIDPLKMYIK